MVRELTSTLDLRQIFERNRERPWLFVRPGGNWGDYLIYAGAEKMAEATGLDWTSCDSAELEHRATPPGHCIYLHGSGGYNSWASGRPFFDLERSVTREVHLVVQGPQSCEAAPERLKSRFERALASVRCRDLIFFAREQTSLHVLQTLGLEQYGATLGLDHDTALALEPEDLCAIAGLHEMPRGNYDLIVFREDNERLPPGLNASHPTGVVIDPAGAATSFAHWMRIHLYSRAITTNRLHSAIVCAIAGKPVTIAPGSYHKNRSVWEHSLSEKGVAWTDAIRPQESPFWSRLPRFIRNSYKVGRMRLMLHRVPIR
jgi:hypothetical protein